MERQAQLDRIIQQELNIKEIDRVIATTERGRLILKFNGDYQLYLEGQPIIMTENILKFVEEYLKQLK